MNPAFSEFQHPADGFYMIEPLGDHPNTDAGVIQVIDAPALAAIVANFEADAENPNFAGLLVDHEHFASDPEKESLAYGWLTAVEARADGLYGQIRWTATGQAAVNGGDYRFFSTEYFPSDLQALGSDRVRPLRLAGLTVTNAPNNKGGKPITNRATRPRTGTATSPQAVADEAVRLARAICNRSGCRFEYAWSQVRKDRPELFRAVIPAAKAPQAPAIANRRAASDRDRAVSDFRSESGCDFSTAWNHVRNRRPQLFAITP